MVVCNASQRNKNSLMSLKNDTDHCLESTLYRAIYLCIMIHQRQYIDTSKHCIIATLVQTNELSGLVYSICATTMADHENGSITFFLLPELFGSPIFTKITWKLYSVMSYGYSTLMQQATLNMDLH